MERYQGEERSEVKNKVIPYLIARGRGYSITIVETPNGFYISLKHNEEKVRLQIDLLKFLEVSKRIQERVSRIAK